MLTLRVQLLVHCFLLVFVAYVHQHTHAARTHPRHQTDELAQSREANTQAQIEIKSLSRAYDRALQTRNRTLAWRQRQIAVASARNFHRALLLEWRSLVLSEQRRSARDLEAQLQAKTARLEAVEQQLRAKLATTRSFLSATRVEVAEFPQRLALLRDEVCQVQLPQLLEHVRAASESCSMALADGEARQRREVDAALKVLATRKAMVEARQRAMLKLLRKTKRLEIGRQAFYVRVCECRLVDDLRTRLD